MELLHISAECYPAAKAGGLGDVVGALPKYLCLAGVEAGVIIPKYHTKWIYSQRYIPLYAGLVRLHNQYIPFSIQQYIGPDLGYPLFVVDIPGKFDRPGIYTDENGRGYGDEVERYLCFQQAVLKWVQYLPNKPKVLHCHDHHTGLIPFFVQYATEYQDLANIPTVFTIHNGQYHGSFSWEKLYWMPYFHGDARGLLEWAHRVNPLASGIRCAWRFTTVSPGYLYELRENSNGLESLIGHEWHKAHGIINGIDTKVWDPAADTYIHQHFNGDIGAFKAANKAVLLERFHIKENLPIITFIGRLVGEKGADIIPGTVERYIGRGGNAAFIVLGTGIPYLHEEFERLRHRFPGHFDAALEYNEGLAHQLYAGSDFLLMPSRVEPCGLNQMYAMRYGTVPIVRSVGGLRNTVIDVDDPNGHGRGIRFDQFSVEDAFTAVYRAGHVFNNTAFFHTLRQRIMALDFSWQQSARKYIELYGELVES